MLVMSGAELSATSVERVAHKNGECHPRTGEKFSSAEQQMIDSLDVSQLGHETQEPAADALGVLSKDLANCDVNELKSFIVARGGSIGGLKKAELEAVVRDYLAMDAEQPAILINRSSSSGLMLSNVYFRYFASNNTT